MKIEPKQQMNWVAGSDTCVRSLSFSVLVLPAINLCLMLQSGGVKRADGSEWMMIQQEGGAVICSCMTIWRSCMMQLYDYMARLYDAVA